MSHCLFLSVCFLVPLSVCLSLFVCLCQSLSVCLALFLIIAPDQIQSLLQIKYVEYWDGLPYILSDVFLHIGIVCLFLFIVDIVCLNIRQISLTIFGYSSLKVGVCWFPPTSTLILHLYAYTSLQNIQIEIPQRHFVTTKRMHSTLLHTVS